MKFGLSRDTIAEQMRTGLFCKPIASLLGPTRDVVTLVTSSSYSDKRLFEMMHSFISSKVDNYSGKLVAIFLVLDNKRKIVDYKSCNSLMRHALKEEAQLVVKVKIRNKYFEFTVKNHGGD